MKDTCELPEIGKLLEREADFLCGHAEMNERNRWGCQMVQHVLPLRHLSSGSVDISAANEGRDVLDMKTVQPFQDEMLWT